MILGWGLAFLNFFSVNQKNQRDYQYSFNINKNSSSDKNIYSSENLIHSILNSNLISMPYITHRFPPQDFANHLFMMNILQTKNKFHQYHQDDLSQKKQQIKNLKVY